jgi:cytochrome b6-f complex iron-sulfur subunit
MSSDRGSAGCSRRAFQLGVCGALGALACGSSRPTVTATNKMLTLTYAQFPALAAPGGSVVVDLRDAFPLAVVRTSATQAVALSATCTHAGCVLDVRADQRELHCGCHGADFDFAGVVLRGPTAIPLPVYPATPGADAILVDLS